MLTNYHTHCFRCQHAEGSVEDYVMEAIMHQFDKLGMMPDSGIISTMWRQTMLQSTRIA